ncbi:MAG: DNA repair protein RecN [Pseudomonadota bacterium]
MLTQLSIRNILLLKSCDIPFAQGLNVLTGETGAGKSILLDALGLVLGERSDAGLVRSGETQASVTAEFDISDHAAAIALMQELGLDPADMLILRRTLAADGKSRAFANDAPVNAGTLKKFGELLVARHGQHDQRGLLDSKIHRQLLDRFANHPALVRAVEDTFALWKAAQAEADAIAARGAEAAREEEWLRHTVAELSALNPQAGEEEALAELRKRAQGAKQSLAALKEALHLLTESGGAALKLRQVAKLIAKLPTTDASLAGNLDIAENAVEEISVALERELSAADINPAELEAADDRLHSLRAAARKYHVAAELLPDLLADARTKLATITNLEADQKRTRAALKQAEEAYRAASAAIHAAREKAGAAMAKTVMKELKPLKMGSTELRVVQSELPPQSWGAGGMHQVSFEVATNAGMPFGALSKVASGGELSRLLLAMKVVLHDGDATTSIFDEIDTGTGGAVAEAIGVRLKQLGAAQQVMVVTHAPQVAALAAHHLFISKDGGKQVVTKVALLDDAARREELARMLSGATISEEARQAAGKLLQAAS